MERARAGRTAGLARAVLERARRRRAGRARDPAPAPAPEEERERLGAALATLVEFMGQATRQCEKYYSLVPACRCKEHEMKHICRYHGRQAGEKVMEAAEEKKNAASVASRQPKTCQQHTRKASKDIYIEVSPGTYSVTATSEDMVKQTHVVDIKSMACS
ncbi:A-kinase-interacting protein 1 isoform X2 [Struthio camelus]|uniref:A-kinase-interacting protein 1 isoform X2 n=2 Tax=Struthio camelus TaxID=8801 RepID=UPI003604011D